MDTRFVRQWFCFLSLCTFENLNTQSRERRCVLGTWCIDACSLSFIIYFVLMWNKHCWLQPSLNTIVYIPFLSPNYERHTNTIYSLEHRIWIKCNRSVVYISEYTKLFLVTVWLHGNVIEQLRVLLFPNMVCNTIYGRRWYRHTVTILTQGHCDFTENIRKKNTL